jgi:hypothetical protein
MELRSRTRLQLRRAAMTAALGALLVPATAGAATKKHTPTISKVAPKTTYVGETLTIQGKYFTRGKGKNSVWFKRDKGKSLLVKAGVSTTRKLQVVIPKSLEKYMVIKAGQPAATRFRLRVLSKRLGKAFTPTGRSPMIGPERPKDTGPAPTDADGDCDGDGVKNGVDADDDNDMLPDTQELALKLNPCSPDSDGDGVEDGYEYQSALDLNNDDYQEANKVLPYPGKRPYPNPLYADADTDYDGDGLTLAEEQALWRYTYQVNHTATRTLVPLSYSDGAQYSLSTLAGGTGRRQPTMSVAAYTPPQSFRAWADLTGYGTPQLFDPNGNHTARTAYDLFDMDHDGVVTTVPRAFDGSPPSGSQLRAERTYWDLDDDNWVSDDERDEDADGLTNFDETHGRLTYEYWRACYSIEQPYPVAYPGTSPVDADTDGDGILDGADDQDFDDVPNVMELSRNMAGNRPIQLSCSVGNTPALAPGDLNTWVNPFNPCLPDVESRTCQRHPQIGLAYPPFDADWKRHILN